MDQTPQVLFIDDDELATSSLIKSLLRRGAEFAIEQANSAESSLQILNQKKIDVAIVDLCLNESIGPDSGLSLISQILDIDPAIRVLVLTGHGSDEYGIQALHRGAASFIEKPANAEHLYALIKDAASLSRLKRTYNEFLTSPSIFSRIPGLSSANPEMKNTLEAAAYAASNNLPVLILGETGTGKGVIAQAIYSAQSHHNKHLVSFYPTYISQDLVNSELFGHQKGAFTGATEARIGLIEEANGGTLFVDEVADIPIETQLAMLRVIQEKKFRRVGSNKELTSDFRLISATNKDLDKLIKDEKFRLDFFHRIAHMTIKLPALRNRKEDIPHLAEVFLKNITSKERINVRSISDEAIHKLVGYNWPGNIRELQACVEGGAYKASYLGHRTIESKDIEIEKKPLGQASIEGNSFREKVNQYEIKIVLEALSKNNNNQTKAAESLQMDRSSLRRILERNK